MSVKNLKHEFLMFGSVSQSCWSLVSPAFTEKKNKKPTTTAKEIMSMYNNRDNRGVVKLLKSQNLTESRSL